MDRQRLRKIAIISSAMVVIMALALIAGMKMVAVTTPKDEAAQTAVASDANRNEPATADPNADNADKLPAPSDHLIAASVALEKAHAAITKANIRNHGGFVEKARANVDQSIFDLNDAIEYFKAHPEIANVPVSTTPTGAAAIAQVKSLNVPGGAGQPNMLKAFNALNACLDELQNASGGDLGGFRDKTITDLDEAASDVSAGFDFSRNQAGGGAAPPNPEPATAPIKPLP